MSVALVHDYLTQAGGAERVVLSMTRAFPEAPVHTSLFHPEGTFPEFVKVDVRPHAINRAGVLRRHHRAALPVLAAAFSSTTIEADVTLCSSSGWAHGVRTEGRKIVYCHAPARWLYQGDRYLPARGPRAALSPVFAALRRWDRRAAVSADRYLANSTAVRDRILSVYGIDAEVLPPPHQIDVRGRRQPVEGVESGFLLCIARLLPYKNVDAVVAAVAGLPSTQLVVVGTGPQEASLRRMATSNVRLVGRRNDAELRWLYANCRAVVSASHEDYGLTPLEGAAFGKPSIVLRWGGFLDTVVEGETGSYFDEPVAQAIKNAVRESDAVSWSAAVIQRQAARYDEPTFVRRLRAIVALEVDELDNRANPVIDLARLGERRPSSAPVVPEPVEVR